MYKPKNRKLQINIINPSHLSDTHLISEYFDILKITTYKFRSTIETEGFRPYKIPKVYDFGKYQNSFWFNKG